MWIAFDVVKKGDSFYMDWESCDYFEEEPDDELYVLNMENYPDIFGTEEEGYMSKMQDGWTMMPRFRFNVDKYNAGENPFEEFDWRTDDYFCGAKRRNKLNHRIQRRINYDAQIKTLRILMTTLYEQLVANGIVDEIPEDLISFNRTIDDAILTVPKNDSHIQKIIDEEAFILEKVEEAAKKEEADRKEKIQKKVDDEVKMREENLKKKMKNPEEKSGGKQ